MKYIQQILVAMTAASSLLLSVTSAAQTSQQTDSAITQASSTQGEVKRVDMSMGKITIKHGYIKNLDMPPMTMVFTVKDKALLNGIAAGDQVRFKAALEGEKIVVTDLEK